MSERKYTDEDVVYMMSAYAGRICGKCELHLACCNSCAINFIKEGCDLINRKNAEVEEFEVERKKLQDRIVSLFNENEGLQTELQIYKQNRMTLYERIELVKKTRTKAVKEFAERVINLIYSADDINPITEWQIDNIVAEMAKDE